VLDRAGSVSHEQAKQVAHDRYERFDAQRRSAEALAADAEDLQALEAVEKRVKGKKA
jgi:hypothetical protein